MDIQYYIHLPGKKISINVLVRIETTIIQKLRKLKDEASSISNPSKVQSRKHKLFSIAINDIYVLRQCMVTFTYHYRRNVNPPPPLRRCDSKVQFLFFQEHCIVTRTTSHYRKLSQWQHRKWVKIGLRDFRRPKHRGN